MTADWTMVVITFIYVIATIAICYYNKKAADAANKQTEIAQMQMQEMIRQYNAVNRPYVTVRFDVIRSGLYCFIVENEGVLPARNIVININQSFLENIKKEELRKGLSAINTSDLYLASKQKFIYIIGGPGDYSSMIKEKAKFDISYNGMYQDSFEIDIAQYESTLNYNSPLDDISQYLKQIKEDNISYHKKVVDNFKRPVQVSDLVVYEAADDDKVKREIYKIVCKEPWLTSLQISERLKLDVDVTLEKLIELLKVDKKVDYFPNDDDYKHQWYKR